jgi:hypothetical protein
MAQVELRAPHRGGGGVKVSKAGDEGEAQVLAVGPPMVVVRLSASVWGGGG